MDQRTTSYFWKIFLTILCIYTHFCLYTRSPFTETPHGVCLKNRTTGPQHKKNIFKEQLFQKNWTNGPLVIFGKFFLRIFCVCIYIYICIYLCLHIRSPFTQTPHWVRLRKWTTGPQLRRISSTVVEYSMRGRIYPLLAEQYSGKMSYIY